MDAKEMKEIIDRLARVEVNIVNQHELYVNSNVILGSISNQLSSLVGDIKVLLSNKVLNEKMLDDHELRIESLESSRAVRLAEESTVIKIAKFVAANGLGGGVAVAVLYLLKILNIIH